MTSTPPAHTPDYSTAAKTTDRSLLGPDLTAAQVAAGCELARAYDVASVCVRPTDVPMCAEMLVGSDVAVGTVVGFPHGANATVTREAEAAWEPLVATTTSSA